MKVDFQLIHSFNPDDVKEKLLDILKETFDESTIVQIDIEDKPDDIENWPIFNFIKIRYNYLSYNDKYIAGFSIVIDDFDLFLIVANKLLQKYGDDKEFDKSEVSDIIREIEKIKKEMLDNREIEYIKLFISNFAKKLQDSENRTLVLKYSDEDMHTHHQKYAEEIFDLEMRLREVISFIFLDTYEGDYYNFLEFQRVKGKGIKKDKKQDVFEEKLENELFYLIFSQYRELYLPNIIKGEILNTLFEKAKSDEDLKNQILSLGIFKHREKYNDFLKSIEDDLQSIEELRNCIAHNRSINDDIIGSYEHGKEKLERSINNFWEEIRNEKEEEE